MKLSYLISPCVAVALVGGWYAAWAAPDRRFETALHSLRENDVEQVWYQLLAIEPCAKLEAQVDLLRGWLSLTAPNGEESRDPNAVMEELNDAAMDDENNRALALALIARMRYENHQLADALLLLEQSLKADPHEVEAHRWVGIILYELGLAMPAIPHLEEVADREPWNGRPHRLLGIIHRERGAVIGDAFAYAAAIEAYQESLKRDPAPHDLQEIRLELGRCYLFRNEWKEALDAIRSCEETAECFTLRAECYYGRGELERAIDCIDQALEQNPHDARALSVKATLVTAKRDTRQAADLLERAIREEPADYNLRYRIVQVYRHLGEDERADPHSKEMDKLLKVLEEQSDLTRRALTDTDPALRFRLAELADRLNDSDRAANWQQAGDMMASPLLRRWFTPAAEPHQ